MRNWTTWIGGVACSLAFGGIAWGQGVYPAPDTFPDLRLEVAGAVNSIVRYHDGTNAYYLIGGDFDLVNGFPRRNLARLNADGTLDANWTADTDGAVNAMVLSGDDLYVGGAFATLDGEARGRLAKVDADDGVVDPAWSPMANNVVNALQTDGASVWAAGTFTAIDGMARRMVARIDAADASLPSFNANFNGPVAFALLVDGGDLYIGGAGKVKQSGNQRALMKVNATTGAAIAWNPGIGPQGGSRIRALVANGSNVYAVGRIRRVGNDSSYRNAAAFAKSNAAVQAFKPLADGEILAIAFDGANAFLAGDFLNLAGHTRLARVDATTGVASGTWNADADRSVASLLVDGTQVLAGGRFAQLEATGGQGGLSRLATSDGTIDATFMGDAAGPGFVTGFAFDAAGGVILGGSFDAARQDGEVTLYARQNIVRLVPGDNVQQRYELDRVWSVNVFGEVNALAIDGDDLYLGGNFSAVQGTARTRLAKLTADAGVVDATWTPTADAPVRKFAMDAANGRLYVAGDFLALNGSARAGLGRLATAGAGATDGWDPAPDDVIDAILPSGANVYLGGSFTNVGGAARIALARVDGGAGTADPAFVVDADAAGAVHALAESADGLYVGGVFSMLGGQARDNAARVVANAVDGWNPDIGGDVQSFAIDAANAHVYLGGVFATAGTSAHPNLARAASSNTGTVDAAWRPGTDGAVVQMAVPSDGEVLAAGSFSLVTGVMRNGVAKLGMQGSDTTQITIDAVTPVGGTAGANSVFGQGYTVAFTVTNLTDPGTTPTGNVTVIASTGESCGPVPANAGSCTLAAAGTGARTLTAAFTGDALFLDAQDTDTHTVDAATIALTLSTSPNPSLLNATADAQITFAVQAPGAGAPTGTVTVTVDGGPGCDIVLPATACTLPAFAAYGYYDIDATYTDSAVPANFAAAAVESEHAVGTPTTLDLQAPATAPVGTPVTVTIATTAIPDGNSVTVTGGSGCTIVVGGNGGSCDITFAAPGTVQLTADFAGSNDLLPAQDTASVDVGVTPTTLDVQIAPSTLVVGESATISLATNLPNGTQVQIGGAPGCTTLAVGSTCNVAYAAVGPVTVTADFAGNGQFGAASDSANASVGQAATAFTAFDAAPASGSAGDTITFTWSVVVSAPGAGTPTGNVVVSVGGNGGAPTCSAPVATGTCSMPFPATGNFTMRADYSGDANFTASESGDAAVQIAPIATTLDLGVAPAAPVVGQVVTLSLTTNLPNGTVVAITDAPGCTSITVGSTCTASFPTAGPRTPSAQFAGNAQYSAAADVANVLVGIAQSAFTAFDATPSIGVPNDVITFTWTVEAVAPGAGTPTGLVTVSVDGNGGAPTCTAPVGVGTCSAAFPSEGTFSMRARYEGDANFDDSLSAAASVDIQQAAPTDGDLMIEKTVSRSRLDLANQIEQVEFLIVVGNAGPASVVGAVVTDTLPAGLSGATWTCTADDAGALCAVPNGSGNVSVAVDLAAGSTATITVLANVAPDAPNVIANTATVAPPQAGNDPSPGNNSSTAFYQACAFNNGAQLSPHFCLFRDGFEGL